MQQQVIIKKINWSRVLPQLVFWLFITLLFLYERRYLIQKAGLPNFVACVMVRLLLLMGLTYLNLLVLIPKFFARGRYIWFVVLLLLSLALYVVLQSAYDMLLFGFIIADSRRSGFWYSIPYNMVTSAWYLLITVSFKISFDWLQQKRNPVTTTEVTVQPEAPEYIYLKTGVKTVKTRIDAITYIQGLKDYSIIYTNEEKIVTKGTLKYIESILPADTFLRIHKSYIIAKNKIVAVERTKVILSSQVTVPVGRNFQDRLEGF